MAAILDSSELNATAFEPKVSNRFVMYIDGFPSYILKKSSAPGFETGEITLEHINVYRKIKGKVRWKDIEIELYDPVTPSGSQAVMEWLRLSHESVTGRDGYSDTYKKDIVFQLLDPPGGVVSEWIIKGAFVKASNFGTYDWGDDKEITVSMTLACDYCILNF